MDLLLKKFESTFNRVSHIYNTRGNNRILTLPKVKSENGRKSFEFSGAKLFNNLPTDLCNEQSLVIFKNRLKTLNLRF